MPPCGDGVSTGLACRHTPRSARTFRDRPTRRRGLPVPDHRPFPGSERRLLFGAPIFLPDDAPAGRGEAHGSTSKDFEALAHAHVEKGYTAAYAPKPDPDDAVEVRAARTAFQDAGVVIAEVQCWNNLLDPDETRRRRNLDETAAALALADELGARCAINTVGSFRAEGANHHHQRNFGEDAFVAAVDMARSLIDSVKPKRAKFAFEVLAMHVTDSPETLERLVEAVDREAFGVHVDLVNWINSPRRYWFQGLVIEEFVRRLGPYIVAAHAKDIVMEDDCDTVRLSEVKPGCGNLDYVAYLRALGSLPRPVTLLAEHLASETEYDDASRYIRKRGREAGVMLGEPSR